MTNLQALLAPLETIFHVIFYEPVFNLLMLIYHGVGNFGAAVIIVTLVLRCALIPLTRKQLKSSREMQVLQPMLAELKQRYGSEPQRLMEEQRKLYKEHGVNPLSGCLPLLVQMPFLYALYFSFYTVLPGKVGKINADIYPFLPHLKFAPDLHFLWLDQALHANLGTPDPLHILPIAAGLLTLIQLRMAMPVRKKAAAGRPSDPTTQASSTMMYIMPLFTVFIGWRFYSGLALYWAFSTGFSAVQQYFINGRNFGSLFKGIPGMEHLVPTPQDTATPVIRNAAAAAREQHGSRPAGRPAPAAQDDGTEAPSGIFGRLLQQLREGMPQASAVTETTAGGGTATTGRRVIEDADLYDDGDDTTARPGGAQRPRPRRSGRTGPVLLQPGKGAPVGDDAVDQAIADGTHPTALPETRITRDGAQPAASNGNGHSASNGNGSSNGNGNHAAPAQGNGNGQNSVTNENGTRGNGVTSRPPARKPTGKSSSAARANRPKGGR